MYDMLVCWVILCDSRNRYFLLYHRAYAVYIINRQIRRPWLIQYAITLLNEIMVDKRAIRCFMNRRLWLYQVRLSIHKMLIKYNDAMN